MLVVTLRPTLVLGAHAVCHIEQPDATQRDANHGAAEPAVGQGIVTDAEGPHAGTRGKKISWEPPTRQRVAEWGAGDGSLDTEQPTTEEGEEELHIAEKPLRGLQLAGL